MITIPIILQYLAVISLVVGAVAYVFKTFRETTVHYDDDTIKRLKDAYDALDSENKRLRSQIIELQAAVKALQEANTVLQNTVTGKDLLAMIQTTLNKFEFIIPLMDEFKKHDEDILRRLELIEARLPASRLKARVLNLDKDVSN
jgi:hypothetical protein